MAIRSAPSVSSNIRWPQQSVTAWEHLLGDDSGAEDGIQLLAKSTKSTRGNLWKAFELFCKRCQIQPLPAAEAAAARCLGAAFKRGAVKARPLQPCLSAINRRHEDLGCPPPAKGASAIIKAAREGFARLQQVEQGHLPLAPAPLPAALVGQALTAGLTASSISVRRQAALLALARPGAAGLARINDIKLHRDAMEAQLRSFKRDMGRDRLPFRARMQSAGASARCLIERRRISLARDALRIFCLLCPARCPNRPVSSADISAMMRKLLRYFTITPPLGRKHAGGATRAGAVSAAHAILVDIETMRWMWGSKPMEALRAHCLDPRMEPPPAVEEFLGISEGRQDLLSLASLQMGITNLQRKYAQIIE